MRNIKYIYPLEAIEDILQLLLNDATVQVFTYQMLLTYQQL